MRAHEAGALGRQLLLLSVRVVERADGACSGCGEESGQCGESGADRPRGLPVVGVVGGDGQADLLARLESPTRGEHDDVGRAERVVGRKQYSAVVQPARIWRAGGTAQCEVPLEQVVVQWGGDHIDRPIGGPGSGVGVIELHVLAHDALHGGIARIGGGENGRHQLETNARTSTTSNRMYDQRHNRRTRSREADRTATAALLPISQRVELADMNARTESAGRSIRQHRQ